MKTAGAACLLAAVTAAAAAAGFASGQPALLPIVCLLPAWPLMMFELAAGRRARAVGAMLVWSAALGVTMTALCLLWPARAAVVVWNGPAYATQMFQWIATGEGLESEPARFVPRHLLEAGLFVGLSLLTGSLASLLLGVLLLNFMAFYVAQVGLAAGLAPLALAVAWHPWSLVRVVSYVVLGVVLAEPLLRKLSGRGPGLVGARSWVVAALLGLGADLALKAALAPRWGLMLRSLTGGGALPAGGAAW